MPVHFASHSRRTLLDDLQQNLLSRSRSCRVQEISHSSDRMSVAPDHLPDVRFAHLDFEDQFATLLYFCHQDLFRRFDKLPDDKLEKGLHRKSLDWHRNGFFAGFQNHARDRRTGLSAVRHPIINAAEVQMKIFTRHARIVVSDRFNKFPVARTAFVRHHHTIERTVFRSFSP